MEYKVGLVADLISGKKKPVARGKLADLFACGKSTISESDHPIQKPVTTPSTECTREKKLMKVHVKSPASNKQTSGVELVPSRSPGFNPPPGIVHESLASSSSKQLPGTKRKKTDAAEDSDDEAKISDPKRPRRDRLKKATEKRTVFVGNLPLSCNKKKLTKLFRDFGDVESVRFRCAPVADPSVPKRVSVITKEFHDQRHNISGYVCFKEKESAKKALSLNGHVFDGLHIRVDSAAPTKAHDSSRSVFVGNLSFAIEEETVRDHFEDCGDIENVRIIRDRKTNLGKGFCYILFKSKDSVSLAMKLHNSKLQGRELRIQRCSEQGAAQGKKKLQSATSRPRKLKPAKTTSSAEGVKFKRPAKFWQPTNSTASFQAQKSAKDKKLKKKAKLKNKRQKVDEISHVLGPLNRPPDKKRGGKQIKSRKDGKNLKFKVKSKEKRRR